MKTILLLWLTCEQGIKRQWGFYYIMTKKGIKRASADVGFIFIAYNLRRIFNIVKKDALKKFLKGLGPLFFRINSVINAFCFNLMNYVFSTLYPNLFFSLRPIALN